MCFLLRFLAKVAVNAGALWLATRLIQGFEVIPHSFSPLDVLNISPLAQSLIVGGLVLALLNAVVRPILKLLSFPLIIITFGLFHIVINMAILYFADTLLAPLAIEGFKALFFSSLMIGIVNAII